MFTKGLLLCVLIILQASCFDFRLLTDNSDHCVEYCYLDKKGNLYDSDCGGCKKVCKKCEKGYYLDDNYKCKKMPDYCDECDKYGKCKSCVKGYYLDKDTYKCKKLPDYCVKVD